MIQVSHPLLTDPMPPPNELSEEERKAFDERNEVLRKRAAVNQIDAVGRTPLHLVALFNPHAAAIDAVLDAGANPDAEDAYGMTAFDYAQRRPELIVSPSYDRLRLATTVRGAEA